jgi:endonuclease YncB( thermonuclease family)
MSYKLRLLGMVVAVALMLATQPGPAADTARLVGKVSFIDGDTFKIQGRRIRLFGMDAPETRQVCVVNKREYMCGRNAALALAGHIGQQTVICDARDLDRYGRIVAVCTVGGEDIGAWMVLSGWALAFRRYSVDYVDEENTAHKNHVGMWRGNFIPPWEWRKLHK